MEKIANLLKPIARRLLPYGIQKQLRAYYLTRKVLAETEYTEPEMASLASLVLPGQIALDVGANVGFYSKVLSRLAGSAGKVYSFEPISENYRILDRIVKDGKLTNVRTFFAAVGSESGTRDMVIPNNSDFTGFYQARLADEKDAGKREQVTVISLDQLHREGTLPSVDFIKCDAEGSELGVLLGASELLKKFHPSLLVEIQRKTSGEVFDLLHNLGYSGYILENSFQQVDRYDSKFWNYFFFYQKQPPNAPAIKPNNDAAKS